MGEKREETTNSKKLLRLKASAGKRTQCSEERAIQIQHAKGSIKPNCQPTQDSYATVDPAERDSEECAFPEEDNRFLLRHFPNPRQVLKKAPTQILTGIIHVRRKHNKK
jgi:hypothetical protein